MRECEIIDCSSTRMVQSMNTGISWSQDPEAEIFLQIFSNILHHIMLMVISLNSFNQITLNINLNTRHKVFIQIIIFQSLLLYISINFCYIDHKESIIPCFIS